MNRAGPLSTRLMKRLPEVQLKQQQFMASIAATQGLKEVSDLPGPISVPVFGSGLSMVMSKHFNINEIHKYWMHASETYGPIFKADFVGLQFVMLSDPNDIQKLMESVKNQPDRMQEAAVIGSIRRQIPIFEGKGGLIVEDGEEWWRVRKGTQAPMMKPKIVRSYLESHNLIADEFLDRIETLKNENQEMPENFLEEIYKWALESVGLVALDRRLGCLDPTLTKESSQMKIIQNANTLFEASAKLEMGLRMWRFFSTPMYKKMKRAQEAFVELADESIRKTVEALEHKDEDSDPTLMQTLMRTPGLAYSDVITMVLDMLLAGIDTTSHTVGFTLYNLSKNPEKQEKLQEEVDRVVGKRKIITKSDIDKLSYLKLVVKESLRQFPLTFGVARKVITPLEIKGYYIPEGIGAIALNSIASWNENIFPRAKEFIPERWDRSRPLGPIHPFASLPFGVGTRMCIGRRIAEQEIYTIITKIMQKYNVEYHYKDVGIRTTIVFIPSEPLKFRFLKRN